MPSVSSRRRLYLRGLRKDVTEDELSKYLSCYGKINEVKLLSSYAFVQFESEQDAATVLETYRTEPLLGNHIVIEFAHPLRKDMPSISSSHSSEKSKSSSRLAYTRHPVIVQDLPRDIRWQELKDFGRSSGMLVAYCDLDKTQKGKGFIEFFTREDAKYAARVLDGRRLDGKKVRVMDHESMRGSERSVRRGRGQNRSRESSPRRMLGSDRAWADDHPSHLQEYSSARRSYEGFFGSLTASAAQDYGYSENRHPASPYESNEEQIDYPGRGLDNDANHERINRVSNWAVHHNCYESNEYEYNPTHYLDRGASLYIHRDPGYEQEIHRDYLSGRMMDPYQ